MKKITLTEDELTKIISKVIKEQTTSTGSEFVDDTSENEEDEIGALHTRIDELEEQLHTLQDEYSRKIGFGDHHVISHDH